VSPEGPEAWGKRDAGGVTRSLSQHCLDVAAGFEALLRRPVFRRAAERADGRPLDDATLDRLAVLAHLHDAGKLNAGFQLAGGARGRRGDL
jgi:CRISPR-associated endonuclease/helicase Cas3